MTDRRPLRTIVATSLVATLVAALAGATSAPAHASTCPTAAASYGGGTGTAPDSYRIDTVPHLLRLSATAADWSSDFIITTDLDLTGCAWSTIGTSGSPYSGTFDGDGHTITGLTFSGPAENGLFGAATTGAVIKDLTLAGVSVSGGPWTGGLVGTLDDGTAKNVTISDVTVTGTVTSTGSFVGGIAGSGLGATFTRVRFEGTITANAASTDVGGIVGRLGAGAITDGTVASTTITSTGSYVGGVAGSAPGATFTRVGFDGSIAATGGSTDVGGIVGQLGAGTLSDATVTATVTSEHRSTGGVVGSVSVGSIQDASFSGTVHVQAAKDEAGGIVGLASNSSIEDAHASGTVTGGGQGVGGVVGNAARSVGTMAITRSSFSGTVTSTGASVGGLAGTVSTGITVTRSWTSGSVTGPRTVGGLIGYMAGGSVAASYSTADATISDASTLDPNLGGLIGAMASVTVTDVYARGDLTNAAVADDIGGLIGDTGNSSPDNVIERAYSTGAVPGTDPTVGGLAGGPNGDVHRDSFWDTVTSGQATSLAGTGKTTAELTTISTFDDTATVGLTTAWPIVDGWQPYVAGTRVWGICPRVNDGYPFLLWQYDSDPCTVPAAAATPTLGVTCATDDAGTLPVGSPITCTLTGGPADFDILWRAAYNPTFAEGVIRTGTDGTGTLTLTLPAAAAGSPITVELVAWTAPIPVGTAAGSTADGPVPTAIPAGDAPGTRAPLSLLTLLAAMLLVATLRGPMAIGTRPRRSL